MKKSGHSDVPSSRRMCQTLIEDANEIITGLPTDEEASLPTWWTNKLAVSTAYLNSLRDYLLYGVEDEEDTTSTSELKAEPDYVQPQSDSTSDGQVTIGDYTTKHFDICPTAQNLYNNIRGKTDMIHLIVETMMLQDLFFRLEKQAIAMGSIDQEELDKAEEFAELIMDNAERMNLEAEHSYINEVHMAKFKQLAGVTEVENEEEEDESMLPPSVRMMRYASKAR
jgi:hypothetical protein